MPVCYTCCYLASVQLNEMQIHVVACTSALKLGWVTQVIRVMFCLGHLGQTQFKNYLDLTWIGSCAMQN